MRSKFFVFAALLIVASMVLAACQPAAPAEPETIVQTVIVEGESVEVIVTATPEPAPAAEKVVNFVLGPGDIPGLDPSLAEDTSSIQVAMETFGGLTRLNELTNETQPGMATSWDISEDGTVYTFNLRDDVSWVKYDGATDSVVQVMDDEGNPRMVTADDFYYGFMRTLDPATGSPYAYVLANVVAGAEDYLYTEDAEANDPASVGIKVIDDYTLEITFNDPAAFNAAIAGMWMGYAQPSWLIEERGERWTETGFFQGYGPFVMKEWVHDAYLDMVKNPFWPGTDEIPTATIDRVHFLFLDDGPGLAEYEAGNADVTRVPLSDLDRVKVDPVLSEELLIAPYFCSYYYGFNTAAEFTDDVRVRRALSYAIDRQALIDNVTKANQIPSQWLSNPGLAAAPTLEEYPDLGIKSDAEAGKAELQSYLDENGLTVDDVQITLMFNTNEGHQKIAEAIQQMWQDALGITVNLTNQEWKVFLQTVDGTEAPQVFRLGWCLDYPDANNFIGDVFREGGNSNTIVETNAAGEVTQRGGIQWYNEEFETLIVEAAKELDNAKRTEMYARAEQIAVYEDAVFAPIYWYSRVVVTKPYVTRTFSVSGQEYFEKWDIDMSAK